MDTTKNTKCTKSEICPNELNILCFFVVCEASMGHCGLGIKYDNNTTAIPPIFEKEKLIYIHVTNIYIYKLYY